MSYVFATPLLFLGNNFCVKRINQHFKGMYRIWNHTKTRVDFHDIFLLKRILPLFRLMRTSIIPNLNLLHGRVPGEQGVGGKMMSLRAMETQSKSKVTKLILIQRNLLNVIQFFHISPHSPCSKDNTFSYKKTVHVFKLTQMTRQKNCKSQLY